MAGLASAAARARFKLVFFCPRDKSESVLNSLFAAYPKHAGSIGNYEHVAFMSEGIGQFRPTEGANPVIGKVGDLEKVEEHRIELLVTDDGNNEQIRGTVETLKKNHPYEEVAYEVYRVEDF